jgi:hypothetical protein
MALARGACWAQQGAQRVRRSPCDAPLSERIRDPQTGPPDTLDELPLVITPSADTADRIQIPDTTAPGGFAPRAMVMTALCNGNGASACDDRYVVRTGSGALQLKTARGALDVVVAISAGADGIAQTEVWAAGRSFNLRVNSAWRNPERNEAVGGVINSRHQVGEALDLDLDAGVVPGFAVPSLLFCVLETAGEGLNVNGREFHAFAEEGGIPRPCNYDGVTHVHIQPRQ